jgi:hypothetical protein
MTPQQLVYRIENALLGYVIDQEIFDELINQNSLSS